MCTSSNTKSTLKVVVLFSSRLTFKHRSVAESWQDACICDLACFCACRTLLQCFVLKGSQKGKYGINILHVSSFLYDHLIYILTVLTFIPTTSYIHVLDVIWCSHNSFSSCYSIGVILSAVPFFTFI